MNSVLLLVDFHSIMISNHIFKRYTTEEERKHKKNLLMTDSKSNLKNSDRKAKVLRN